MIIFDDIEDMDGYPIEGTGQELTEEFNRLAKRGQSKRLTPKKFNWVKWSLITFINGVIIYIIIKIILGI